MKYVFGMLMLSLLAMASAGAVLWAQSTRPTTGPAPAAAPAAVKIGLVNLGVLFRDQNKVKDFKARLDVKLKPFEDKNKEMEKLITSWTKALKDPGSKLSDTDRERGYKIILECRRQMQDLEEEYHKGIGGELGAEMVALDKEIKQGIKLYAEVYGYHLILAYGEPEKQLPPLQEFGRRMTAIDAGNVSFVQLPGTNPFDVTRGVLDLLNSSYKAGTGASPK